MNKETIDASPHIATAKIFSFESLSSSCRLQGAIGYEVGTKDRLHVRVISSDGPGKFNTCWWSLAAIENTLAKVPEQAAFKASVLASAFVGRSVNTMYYVLALLLHCQLLRRADPVENGYVRNVPAELLQELSKLVELATDLLPPAMDPGAAPMVVTIPKATEKSPKKAKKAVAPTPA
jgi:hypothetical protein